jgi:hypothetical protein
MFDTKPYEEKIAHAFAFFEEELKKVRTGRAHPGMLDADPNGEHPENAIVWQQLKELRKKNVNWSVIS